MIAPEGTLASLRQPPRNRENNPSTQRWPMKQPWTLADILDIEFFFNSDDALVEQGKSAAVDHRDRHIYLASNLDAPATSPDNQLLANRWLAARRQDFLQQQAILPGQVWMEMTTLSAWLLFGISLLFGSALTASFLHYSGVTPVNVSGYFAFFILLQLVILLLNLSLFGYRLVRRTGLNSSILYRLLAQALTKLFAALYHRARHGLDGKHRLDLDATLGSIRQGHQIYGTLFLWPIFLLLQLAGIGFNLGVLLTTLAKVALTDIAFGWQSTLPVSEVFLADLIRIIAQPWAWLLPEHLAYPSIEQIIGSKIVLKDGIWQLATADLAAWWPFLCCGVLVYGLLPRLLLFCVGRWQLSTRLKRLDFDSAHYRQLRRRMLTPSVQTAASHSIAPLNPSPSPATATPAQSALKQHTNRRGWLLLIPDELWDQCPTEKIAPYLHHIAPDEPLVSLRYGALDQSGQAFLEQLIAIMNNDKLAGIMLLQEAWQPPIRELTTLLRQLRQLTTPTTPLTLALTGRSQRGEIITAVPSADLQLWQKTVKTLADPYLEIFALMTEQ